MPTFLSDPPQIVYIVLGLALVVTGAIAAQRQDRRSTIAFAVAALLMLLLFLIDRLFESPREEAVRRSFLMATAAEAKNPDAFVDQLADTFEFAYGNDPPRTIKREEFKKSPFWAMLNQYSPRVTVSGFSHDDVKVIDEDTIEIGFMAKGEADGKPYPFYVRTTYRRQPDKQLKLVLVRVYDPLDHTKGPPIPFPNVP